MEASNCGNLRCGDKPFRIVSARRPEFGNFPNGQEMYLNAFGNSKGKIGGIAVAVPANE